MTPRRCCRTSRNPGYTITGTPNLDRATKQRFPHLVPPRSAEQALRFRGCPKIYVWIDRRQNPFFMQRPFHAEAQLHPSHSEHLQYLVHLANSTNTARRCCRSLFTHCAPVWVLSRELIRRRDVAYADKQGTPDLPRIHARSADENTWFGVPRATQPGASGRWHATGCTVWRGHHVASKLGTAQHQKRLISELLTAISD
jgi:hypothetical protein